MLKELYSHNKHTNCLTYLTLTVKTTSTKFVEASVNKPTTNKKKFVTPGLLTVKMTSTKFVEEKFVSPGLLTVKMTSTKFVEASINKPTTNKKSL